MLVCSGWAVTGCMTARKRPVKLTEADITRPDPADVDTMTTRGSNEGPSEGSTPV